ncbi:MAG: ABC transporter permease subunit, partial [Alphaproteobacteria bacterium]|nr:ABC transporter permease subunit [Alphaproteobacteria bacterium]
FVNEVMVVRMGHFSAWAGAASLAIILVPVVVRTTENMLTLVPASLREAAVALGAPQWKVIVMVVYRAALQGMLTGVMLGVARIAGETAPLLFTAFGNNFWSTNMNAPMANLPMVIFQFALSPYADWQLLAWGGALVITLAILVLNIAARMVANWSSFGK